MQGLTCRCPLGVLTGLPSAMMGAKAVPRDLVTTEGVKGNFSFCGIFCLRNVQDLCRPCMISNSPVQMSQVC